jgi:DeoR family fructose operon transcriptional repressor
MLKSARKQKILELVNQNGCMTLEKLAQAIATSESTLRRDLTELDKSQQLRRVHGGAESLSNLQYEENMTEKSVKNVQAKRQIAQKAINKLKTGEVIFMDAGTTVGMMVEFLTEQMQLTVVTNSVQIATDLLAKAIPTVVIGGTIKLSTGAVIGNVASQQLKAFNFNKAFVGANGISREGGITTADPEEAAIKQLVMQEAKETYILADSSKLGQIYFAKIAAFDDTIDIITEELNDIHSDA